MRVLHVSQVYHPSLDKGGPVRKIRALGEHLAARGCSVTVLTSRPPELARDAPAKQWLGPLRVFYLPTILRYRTATINRGLSAFRRRHFQPIDMVHIFGLYDMLGLRAARWCRDTGTPYLVEPLGMARPRMRSRVKKWLYLAAAGNDLMKRACAIIAASDRERQDLRGLGVPESRVVVRRNGLDLDEFRSAPPAGMRGTLAAGSHEVLIGFLGRVSFIKGLDLLVRAFAGLEGKARLVIAGPDDGDGCLQAITPFQSDSMRIIGPLYGDDRLRFLHACDVFVLPSRYESFGNAAAEAIACGKPVLVTDQCGIAPLIDGRAAVVAPCTVDGLRSALVSLVDDHDRRRTLAAGCAAIAELLTWSQPADQTLKLYQDCVVNASASGRSV